MAWLGSGENEAVSNPCAPLAELALLPGASRREQVTGKSCVEGPSALKAEILAAVAAMTCPPW